MLIDSINLNHLRIFECVYRSQGMTRAASELHLTQSGVSQHIKTLEDILGVQLFDRIRQRCVPTDAANVLYRECSKGLHSIEEALLEIRGEKKELSGEVRIGMPIEFGNNVVLPLLSVFSKKYPRVKFKIELGFASTMNAEILQGSLDFAFVDQYTMDRRIVTEKVFDEVLDLCLLPEIYKKQGPPRGSHRAYFEKLDYVDYQDGGPVLRMWFSHHLKTHHLNLNVKAVIMDVQGMARLVLAGMGAGILPHHLVLKLEQEGKKLHRFEGCGKPLRNSISVAHLKDRTQSPQTCAVLQALRASFVN